MNKIVPNFSIDSFNFSHIGYYSDRTKIDFELFVEIFALGFPKLKKLVFRKCF